MEINPRRKRHFHLYNSNITNNIDNFGFIAGHSMYSTIFLTELPTIHEANPQTKHLCIDLSQNTLEEDYRAAVARLAPFLPIQLRIPKPQIPNIRRTRRRDWWATQKRRRFWRKNPTRKAIAYRHRRTFRGNK